MAHTPFRPQHPGARARRPLARAACVLAILAGAVTPAVPAQTLDFQISKLEVNQAIQAGGTPLVAGRTTVARVGVRIINPSAPTIPVDGLLRVLADGAEVAASPIFSDNGPFPATTPIDFAQEHGTLNFTFLAPESASVVLQVEVNPAGPNFVPEVNTANNTFTSAPLAFVFQRTPDLAYAPIDYRPGGGPVPNLPSAALIEPGMGDNFVQGIYPTPDWHYHRTDAPSKLWTATLSGTGSDLLNSLQVDLNLMQPKPDFLYGFVPGGLPYNGQAVIGGNVAMGNTEPIRYQRTFAHELGHNFGLLHNSVTTGLVGVDVEHHLKLTQSLPKIKAATLKDIMVAGLVTSEAWVASGSYNFLHSHPVFNPAQNLSGADGDAPVLMLAGLWNPATGSVEWTDVLELPAGTPTSPAPDAEAELMLRTWSGTTLVTQLPLRPRTSADDCPDCGAAARGPADVSAAGGAADSTAPVSHLVAFTALLPAAAADGARIDRVLLEQAGTRPVSTAVLQRSASAPQVAFTAPTGAALDGSRVQVAWEARDADGDPLSVHLRFSPDGEQRFVPLSGELSAGTLGVDLDTLPAFIDGRGCFELLVSDGLNTTRVRSAPLQRSGSYQGSAGSAPWVQMITPDNATVFAQGASVVLHSSGWDLEDHALSGESLQWSSSIDGVLGTGRLTSVRTLSPGVHVLTVQATDSTGQTAVDTATVTVLARGLPTLGDPVCQQDLGFGGPGSAVLSLCGDALGSGGTATLQLTGAAPLATAFLFAGFANAPVGIHGGTLVPNPALLISALATDAGGALSVAGIAGGGGPFTAFVQVVVVDGAQSQGYAFSNALQVEFLP